MFTTRCTYRKVRLLLLMHRTYPFPVCMFQDHYRTYSAMASDEDIYQDASRFYPERFLPETGEPVPTNAAFGFGRRLVNTKFAWQF